MKDTLTIIRELTLNSLMKFSIDWKSRPYEEYDIGYEWTKVHGGYARCLTSGINYSTIEVIISPNTTYDFHIHPDADEEFYVIEGHVELTVLKTTQNVRAGEVFSVRAGLLHKAFYPYGMRGIITLRKKSLTDERAKKVEVIETLLKKKEEETEASPSIN